MNKKDLMNDLHKIVVFPALSRPIIIILVWFSPAMAENIFEKIRIPYFYDDNKYLSKYNII